MPRKQTSERRPGTRPKRPDDAPEPRPTGGSRGPSEWTRGADQGDPLRREAQERARSAIQDDEQGETEDGGVHIERKRR